MTQLLFLGPTGSHSEYAAKLWYAQNNDQLELQSCKSIPDIYNQLSTDANLLGILPVENSIGGDVSGSFDRLFSKQFKIRGEIFLQIKHHLLGLAEANISEVDTVFVHPQAALQCSKFLSNYPTWKQISVSSTSLAAQKVCEDGNPRQVAISGKQASLNFELQILEPAIGDFQDNYTRFLILEKAEAQLHSFSFDSLNNQLQTKRSIIFQAPHNVGSLAQILSTIAQNGGNLTKIESRPIPEKPWNYMFYADFIAGENFKMDYLEAVTSDLFELGKYMPGNSVKED
jgi:prephenate dehydratase